MYDVEPGSHDGVIIPPHLAVRAMRDSGYRNTAYALAELIDNAVQANASLVDVIILEGYELVSERERRHIDRIGVLDDGTGMSPATLRAALQFGNGSHLNDRRGIGRFGMGLPNSSISQCRRVDVWTWQAGPDNATHTYLDVDEIESGSMREVPVPQANSVPDEWRSRATSVRESGTLVVWSKFDEHRLSWRGANATMRHAEALAGRMYRKFIDGGRLIIRMKAYSEGDKRAERDVRVNDPLYLMRNSTTPAPFDHEPMFQPWGEGEERFEIEYGGDLHIVSVRMSWAREETLPDDGTDRGRQPYGKHAAKNLGLSIVRLGRELDLDAGWTNSYDPTERWWGVEVEFPPSLDEVFGVTNNKQSATIFSDMSQYDWSADAEPGETLSAFREKIQAEGDPRALLLPIVIHIKKQISEVRKRLSQQTRGRRGGGERHGGPSVEDRATTSFRQRSESGHETEADKEEFGEEDREKFEEDLKTVKHYPGDVARNIADATLKRKRKVNFLTSAMDGYGFFSVEHFQGGLTSVVFNTNHPLYSQLIEALQPELGDATDEELVDRVHRAADTLQLLFAAWARYEMEDVQHSSTLFDVRQEWGKMARFFLNDDEE